MKKTAVLLVVLLTACATPEQKAQKMIARHAPLCEKLGFAAGTDPWRTCIMQAQAQEDANAAAAVSAFYGMRAAQPRTCQMVGNAMTCY